MLFCIDPGHGGKDPGAVGRFVIDGNQRVFRESDANLSFALLLGETLKNKGADIIYTRTDDSYVSLRDRTYTANRARAKYFISVHHNASNNPSARGTESLVYSKTRIPPVLKLMANHLPKATKFLNRGIIERKNIYVLRRTRMSAILFEVGFMSNVREVLAFTDEHFQRQVVNSIVNPIVKYL